MTILVTGATGNVGRHVVAQLLEAGQPVRALTRRPATANLPEGVEVVAGDLTKPEGLRSAFEGVDRLFLFPVAETAGEVVRMAREAGVRRVVVLSSVSAGYESGDLSGDHHRAVEVVVEASGLEWTHLRPGEFMANLLDWAPSIRSEGVVRAPFPDEESNAVHEADIADVAVAALLDDGHAGRAYEVNGGETLTRLEQVRVIAEVLGTEIRFEELTREQARELWVSEGMAPELADWLLGTAQADGDGDEEWGEEESEPGPTCEAVTGRPPRSFAQWVADHRDDFLPKS